MVLNNRADGLVYLARLDVGPCFIGWHAKSLKDHFQVHALLTQLVELVVLKLEYEVAISGQQVLEDAAESPDVDTIRVGLLQEELRCHEPECADCRDRPSEAHLHQLLILNRMVEVRDLDEPVAGKVFGLRQLLLRLIVVPEDVRWLDVAVHDVPVLVEVE